MTRTNPRGALHGAAALVACAFLFGCSVSGSATVPSPKAPDPKGLQVSPTSVSISPGNGLTLNASEVGYDGAFQQTNNCAGIATIAALGSSQYAVTAIAPGVCTITVSDTSGNSVAVGVSIQTIIIGGQ